jgi:hypothetical protein
MTNVMTEEEVETMMIIRVNALKRIMRIGIEKGTEEMTNTTIDLATATTEGPVYCGMIEETRIAGTRQDVVTVNMITTEVELVMNIEILLAAAVCLLLHRAILQLPV